MKSKIQKSLDFIAKKFEKINYTILECNNFINLTVV